MMQKLIYSIFFCAMLLGGVAPIKAEGLADQAHLIEKAESILRQLDNKNTQLVWEDGSTLFHALNPSQAWQMRNQTLRDAYGMLVSRQFKLISYRATYAFAPDGDYALIQFDSSFANKNNTTETVVLDCTDTPDCRLHAYTIR